MIWTLVKTFTQSILGIKCYDECETKDKYWSRLTIDEIKFYNDTIDISNLVDDGFYMYPPTYEQIKKTHIVSTLPKGPIVDTMEILLCAIIKRKEKLMEWTRVRKKRTKNESSIGGVASGIA